VNSALTTTRPPTPGPVRTHGEVSERLGFGRVTDKDDSGLLIIGSIILTVPLAAWHGWVLARLWLWFVVPLGVPVIDVWHAAGISVIAGWLCDTNACGRFRGA
jgi:hypothetical protein